MSYAPLQHRTPRLASSRRFPAWLTAVVLLLLGAGLGRAEPALVIYPGSFDPFHLAHRQELEKVHAILAKRHPEGVQLVVLPNHNRPKHILKGYAFDSELRTELARVANLGLPFVSVHQPFSDGLETEEQLLAVKAEHPGMTSYLLLGDDAYAGLKKWVGARRVLDSFHLVVSTSPEHLPELDSPAELLGRLGHGYHEQSSTSWVDEKAHSIEALKVRVSPIRSHPILLRLLLGQSVVREVGPRVSQLLRSDRYRRALERNAHTLLAGSDAVIAKHLGAELVEAAHTDGVIATALLALSNSQDPALVRRVASKLKRRGHEVALPRLQALADDPVHAKIFKLSPKKPARIRS